MTTKVNSWPPGTPDFVNHRVINEYIHDTAVKTGVHAKTVYNSRVERIEKRTSEWKIITSMLSAGGRGPKRSERTWVGYLSLELQMLAAYIVNSLLML